MIDFLEQNRWTILSLIIIIPVGFYSKFYKGPVDVWVNDSLGGAFYEIFWCLVVFLFLNKTAPWKIAVVVFSITCSLEFLQLWHPSFLEVIRSNFIGRTIIGTSFVWSDFIYYIFGSLVGWIWLVLLKNPTRQNHNRTNIHAD